MSAYGATTISSVYAGDVCFQEAAKPTSTGLNSHQRLNIGTLRLAVVHPHSGHNYELRYWLAGCGIDPDRDIEIVIVPPPLMAEALGTGSINGYCVGEPWNTAAVIAGHGPYR